MKFPILAYLDLASNLLPISAGLIAIRRIRKPMLAFYFLLVVGGGVEIASFLMAMNRISNLWLIQIYHIIHYLLIVYVMTEWCSPGWRLTISRFMIVAYGVFWLIAKLTFEPLSGDDEHTYTIACIIVMLIAVDLLFRLMKDETTDIPRDARFWMTSGVFMYFAANLFLFSAFQEFTLLPFADAASIWNVLYWPQFQVSSNYA